MSFLFHNEFVKRDIGMPGNGKYIDWNLDDTRQNLNWTNLRQVYKPMKLVRAEKTNTLGLVDSILISVRIMKAVESRNGRCRGVIQSATRMQPHFSAANLWLHSNLYFLDYYKAPSQSVNNATTFTVKRIPFEFSCVKIKFSFLSSNFYKNHGCRVFVDAVWTIVRSLKSVCFHPAPNFIINATVMIITWFVLNFHCFIWRNKVCCFLCSFLFSSNFFK